MATSRGYFLLFLHPFIRRQQTVTVVAPWLSPMTGKNSVSTRFSERRVLNEIARKRRLKQFIETLHEDCSVPRPTISLLDEHVPRRKKLKTPSQRRGCESFSISSKLNLNTLIANEQERLKSELREYQARVQGKKDQNATNDKAQSLLSSSNPEPPAPEKQSSTSIIQKQVSDVPCSSSSDTKQSLIIHRGGIRSAWPPPMPPTIEDVIRCNQTSNSNGEVVSTVEMVPLCAYLRSHAPQARIPPRPICTVCGFLANYTCVACGARYCCLKCERHHSATR
eukprot:gene791-4079_t